MICISCGVRYAPYPEEDFNFPKNRYILDIEIKPKRVGAEKRRREVFESNDRNICCECKLDKEEALCPDCNNQHEGACIVLEDEEKPCIG